MKEGRGTYHTLELSTDLQVKGVAVTTDHVALWSSKTLVVYQLITEGSGEDTRITSKTVGRCHLHLWVTNQVIPWRIVLAIYIEHWLIWCSRMYCSSCPAQYFKKGLQVKCKKCGVGVCIVDCLKMVGTYWVMYLCGIRKYLTKKVCNRKYLLKCNFIFIPNWSAYATILYLEVNVNVF